MDTKGQVGARESTITGATLAPAPVRPAADDGLMQAIVQSGYGTEEVLHLDRVARPDIADNEVLVRVAAAGLDRGTWHMMAGKPYLMRIIGFGLRGPKNPVPGIDVAGTVVEVGASVTKFAIGDQVFGIARGSFAQYAAALESKLAPKPGNL